MATKKEKLGNGVLDVHNCISPSDLEKVLMKNFKTVISEKGMSDKIPPVFVWGSPGIGKSQIVQTLASDLGVEFIDFRLSYRDPVDLHGIPAAVLQENKAVWLQFDDLPHNENGKGIILFDELSSVDRSLQNAALQLILDRRIDKYRIPDGYMIVAAGNKTTDRAISQTMASSLSNRFLHVELTANDEDWRKWAQRHDIDPSVVGFISYRPSMLHKMEGENLERGWPSPRSWERVSTMVKMYRDSESILRTLVYGLVGNGAGVEFMEFFKMNEKMDNVKEIMTNPSLPINIPDRADMKYAMVSAMCYHVWRGSTDEETRTLVDGFYRISMELSADFAAMAMNSAMMGNSEKERERCCDILFNHDRYKEWVKKYGKSLHRKINFD